MENLSGGGRGADNSADVLNGRDLGCEELGEDVRSEKAIGAC